MSDDLLLNRLSSLREAVSFTPSLSSYAVETIDAVIARLTPSAPPADCVPVRIAVSVDEHGNGDAWVINKLEQTDAYALSCIQSGSAVTEAIITAYIPRRSVPEIQGTVEPVGVEL